MVRQVSGARAMPAHVSSNSPQIAAAIRSARPGRALPRVACELPRDGFDTACDALRRRGVAGMLLLPGRQSPVIAVDDVWRRIASALPDANRHEYRERKSQMWSGNCRHLQAEFAGLMAHLGTEYLDGANRDLLDDTIAARMFVMIADNDTSITLRPSPTRERQLLTAQNEAFRQLTGTAPEPPA
jgi:hypothetical protein